MNILPLGIDIAKLKFNACLVRDDGRLRHKVFANSQVGFAQLGAWLVANNAPQVHACLEATGTYGEALATHLADAGHRVSVVNPAAIKSYAGCQLSRTKTDKVDAALIARFCLTQQPPVWTPDPPQIRTLQALVRRLDALIEMHTMEQNRLAAGALTPEVEHSLHDHLRYLTAEIKRTEAAIKAHIGNHPSLKADRDLLLSIPGIGEATTARLLAEVNFHSYDTARSAAAFTGLVPRLRLSGSSVRGKARLSKMGSPRVRHALYFPAVTAIRCSPPIKEWAKTLRERGKCEMQIIGAVMRKLIHLAYGVLKTGKPYDPLYAKNA